MQGTSCSLQAKVRNDQACSHYISLPLSRTQTSPCMESRKQGSVTSPTLCLQHRMGIRDVRPPPYRWPPRSPPLSVTHLEELMFWLFLLHQGPRKRDWFHSWEFRTWSFGTPPSLPKTIIPLTFLPRKHHGNCRPTYDHPRRAQRP